MKKSALSNYDLTVVGPVKMAASISRRAVYLIDLLKDDLNLNYISTKGFFNVNGIPGDIQAILVHEDKTPGTVAILVDHVWILDRECYRSMPASPIKIAYSMFETTRIPLEWVETLNLHFDAVAVPDAFLIDVYQNSGVKIPIFELTSGVFIEDLLKKPPKREPQVPFVFGSTCVLDIRKNYNLLIRAFAEEFGKNQQVILKINGRTGDQEGYQYLIRSLGVSNIFLTKKSLTQADYVEYISSFDCYVNISKGEGFSICPREALALGIPCIISDNTAQKTLCKTGFFRAVPSEIPIPACYDTNLIPAQNLGFFFNCKIEDVREAMRDVYTNYHHYLRKALPGRIWVQRYLWPNLKKRYLNFIKPKTVILGAQNIVTDTYLMTNSKKLYDKYCQNIIDKN